MEQSTADDPAACNGDESHVDGSNSTDCTVSWAELKTNFWLCPLCKLCMRTPKVLPCLHTFCQECLENFLTQKNAVSAGRFKCPVCKMLSVFPQKGVMAFATNTYIEQLQLSNRHTIDKFGDRAVTACTCNLCSGYRTTRQKLENEAKEQKENLLENEKADGEKKTDGMAKFELQACIYHTSETVVYFCVDCQQAACRLCVELRHKDHRFEPLSLAAENARALLKTTQEVLAIRQQSNAKFLSKLNAYADDLKTQKQKTLSEIENYVQQMHDILNRVKDRLISDADRLYSAEYAAATRLSEELELSQQQLVGVSGFLKAHQGHDPEELIQQRYLITDRINQLYAAEQRTNFPLNVSFLPAIPGNSKDEQWLLRAELALKSSIGSVISNRVMTPDFVRIQNASRGEINKAIMVASFTHTIPALSSHEKIQLVDKIHRQSVGNRQMAMTSSSNEVPLTRHLLPSLSIDPFGYVFALDRSAATVSRFFGGSDLAKRVYHFPGERCRPLRICCVGQTGGFAYVDGFSPTATSQAFALRFVPRSGDRMELILPLDRSLFSGGSSVLLPDGIPAVTSDQNANIYVLDIDSDGRAVVIAYSMSFGTVRRIVLDSSLTPIKTEPKPAGRRPSAFVSHQSSTVLNESDSMPSGMSLSEASTPPPAPAESRATTNLSMPSVVSADFASYISCCPHMTGTRDVVPSTSTTTCPGLFAVTDTLRDTVRLYDVSGAFLCELDVPSPLDKISRPRGVAFDFAGNLIVCDQGNNRLLLFDHAGKRLRGILAAGPPALEALRRPADVVAVPGRYQAVVAEETTSVIKIFDYSTLVAPHASIPGK